MARKAATKLANVVTLVQPVPAAPVVRSPHEAIAMIVGSIVSSEANVAALNATYENSMALEKKGLLASIMGAMANVAAITLDAWKSVWAPDFKTALRACVKPDGKPRYASDATIDVMLSAYKTACIALSLGIMPLESETNFDAYKVGARDRIPEAHWPRQTPRAPKPGTVPADAKPAKAADAKAPAAPAAPATPPVAETSEAAMAKLPAIEVMLHLMRVQGCVASRDDANTLLRALRVNAKALIAVAETLAPKTA